MDASTQQQQPKRVVKKNGKLLSRGDLDERIKGDSSFLKKPDIKSYVYHLLSDGCAYAEQYWKGPDSRMYKLNSEELHTVYADEIAAYKQKHPNIDVPPILDVSGLCEPPYLLWIDMNKKLQENQPTVVSVIV